MRHFNFRTAIGTVCLLLAAVTLPARDCPTCDFETVTTDVIRGGDKAVEMTADTSDDTRSVDSMHFVTDDIRALAHTGFHFRGENGEWEFAGCVLARTLR